MPLMESGAIDPPIGSVFALEDAAAAIRAMDERRAVGRLLIRIRGSDQAAEPDGRLRRPPSD
jgi:NADPH2:quinone reductase